MTRVTRDQAMVRVRRERRTSTVPTPMLMPPIATSSTTSVPVNGSVAGRDVVFASTFVVRLSLLGATLGEFGGTGYAAPATLSGRSAPTVPTAPAAAIRTILDDFGIGPSTAH